jgi:hypothetical protein
MAKTTFQGVVRSYGGQNKESNVFAGTVVLAAKAIVNSSTSVYSAVSRNQWRSNCSSSWSTNY